MTEPKTAPDLAKNVKEVVRMHNQINRSAVSSLETAIDAGAVLKTMKDIVGHGNWEQYVKDHFMMHGISVRTAQDYLWCYKNKAELEKAIANPQRAAFLTSIRGAKAWLKGDEADATDEAETQEGEAQTTEGDAQPAVAAQSKGKGKGKGRGKGKGDEAKIIAHLQALSGADEVLDLLKRAFSGNKEFLISLDDLLARYIADPSPTADPVQPTMQ